MEQHLKITGVLLIALALIHILFPKYFKWKVELQSLTLINRQMMLVHTFFVALIVFLMGVLCLTNAHDIIHTRLGNRIALGLVIFWGIRLVFQFFIYSSQLWKGKIFETSIHILFSLLWIYISGVFLYVYLNPVT